MAKLNLILNERKYIEEIIKKSVLPDTVTPNAMITCLTKYYYKNDMTLNKLSDLVCSQMDKFNLSVEQYQEYKAKIRIKRVYNDIINNKIFLLKEYEYISLYKSEYDKIMQCENDREKKLLFTIYILARYTNKYGWVYYSESDIYKLANVSNTNKNHPDLIAKLIHDGFVKDTKKVNDLKIGVDLSDGKEEVVLKISKLSYLGNQFIAFVKPDYKVCEKCGKLIKIKSKTKIPKYCNNCASQVQFDQKKKWDKTSRKR